MLSILKGGSNLDKISVKSFLTNKDLKNQEQKWVKRDNSKRDEDLIKINNINSILKLTNKGNLEIRNTGEKKIFQKETYLKQTFAYSIIKANTQKQVQFLFSHLLTFIRTKLKSKPKKSPHAQLIIRRYILKVPTTKKQTAPT